MRGQQDWRRAKMLTVLRRIRSISESLLICDTATAEQQESCIDYTSPNVGEKSWKYLRSKMYLLKISKQSPTTDYDRIINLEYPISIVYAKLYIKSKVYILFRLVMFKTEDRFHAIYKSEFNWLFEFWNGIHTRVVECRNGAWAGD